MLISINGEQTPTPVSLKITPEKIRKTVTNTLGDEFVYILNTKYKLEISWLPMNQEEFSSLLDSMSEEPFEVTFFDEDGIQVTKDFILTSDLECDVLDHVNNQSRWKPLKVTLKEV